ncbi:phage tail-collar fiber domain-containing protein [Pseudaestuariivita sp.]|uniref:phage tail-collar fiber domain-containing protein n=1 Tax=Pseudaestuariivita sp. TaxID=2211669 RepID=UPI004059449C
MSSDGIDIITDLGEAKLNAAAGSGLAVEITEIALGDGNGANYDPSAQQTALKRELARRPFDKRHMVGTNAWRVTVAFSPDTPAFWVREMGFLDAEGDLIAIWAGQNIAARQTGAVEYALQHVLNFSRVREGLVIVEAPDDLLFDLALNTAHATAQFQLQQLRQADQIRALRLGS